jgi:hypothetical protein
LVADALGSGALIAVLAQQGVQVTPIQAMRPTTRGLAPRIRASVNELLVYFLPLAPWDWPPQALRSPTAAVSRPPS